jgi:8-oxo-dGTP diphosphatase
MQLQVGVKVILIDQNGSILILRRTKPLSNGKTVWDIPGGRINPEETTLEALTREVYEETRIMLSGACGLIDVQDIFPYEDLHIVRLTYQCHIDGRSITLSDEHDVAKWVAPDLLEKYEVDPYITHSLENLHDQA